MLGLPNRRLIGLIKNNSRDSKFTMTLQKIEETIVRIITNTAPPRLPKIDDHNKSLFDYGLDSLDFSSILLEIEEQYGIKITDDEMESLNTINALTEYVSAHT